MLHLQLGLTFTVPFLNIPLTSLNGLFNGNGVSDLLGGLDTSNLFAVGLVAAGAIFILPMLIYWLTGINLSAFNWSRSKKKFTYKFCFVNLNNNLYNTIAVINIHSFSFR